jgi:hypothetical protein
LRAVWHKMSEKWAGEKGGVVPRDPLDARIAIVGAGPAGLSAAWYLKQLGYRDVLVLEKLGRVGGLCKSLTDGYKAFDLGGNYITPSYTETRRIAKSVRAKTYRGKKYAHAHVGGTGADKTLTLGSVKDFVMFDEARSERISYWKIAGGVVKFAYLRWKVRKYVDEPTFARLEERPDLCVSFQDWLEAKRLGFMKRLFEIPIPMMGYGFQDEVAAPYILKYMAPGTYWSMILRGIPGLGRLSPWPRRFELGFQRMWEKLSWGLNVRMDVAIEKISRTKELERPIEITVSYSDRIFHGQQANRVTLYFDRLVICCPLALEVLDGQLHMDLKEEETDVFSRIETFSYCQTTLHATSEAGEDAEFKLPSPVLAITPFSRETIGYPWVVVQVWEEASRMLQFYTRIDPQEWVDLTSVDSWTMSDDVIKQEDDSRRLVLDRVHETLGLLKGSQIGGQNPRLRRLSTFHRWPYFGHVSPGECRAGFYSRLESLQGRHGTYYAGGATTFELIESVIRSSKYITGKLHEDLKKDAGFDSQSA